jgi:hypothetical protein
MQYEMERKFTEKETAEILRRAVKVEPESGLVSESELRAAAREVGIPEVALESAMTAVSAATGETSSSFVWGGPLTIAEGAIAAGNLTDDVWEEAIVDLRRTFGEEGKLEERALVREWSSGRHSVSPVQLSARQTDDGVRISVTSRTDALAFMCYIFSLLPVILMAGILARTKLSPMIGVPIGLAAIFVIFLIVRSVFTNNALKHERACRDVVDRLRARIETPSPHSRVAQDDSVSEQITT